MINVFKKLSALFVAAVIGLCNASETTGNEKKVLVVYFSHTGNTDLIAKKIKEELKDSQVELQRIRPVKNYPEYGDDLRNLGMQEADDDSCRPEFEPMNVNVQDYDLILVGTPTWWYKAPKIMLSFLEQQDFSGKEVRFFITHAGGPGACISDMKTACKGANFGENADIYCNSPGNGTVNYEEIVSWVGKMKNKVEKE